MYIIILKGEGKTSRNVFIFLEPCLFWVYPGVIKLIYFYLSMVISSTDTSNISILGVFLLSPERLPYLYNSIEEIPKERKAVIQAGNMTRRATT